MGILSTIGKGVAKGAKFVFKHRKEIEEAATAAKETASFVSDMKQQKREAKTEKDYFSLVEEENEHLKTAIAEIAEGMDALEELYNGKIQELESVMANISGDLTATKEAIGNQLKQLNENFIQLKKAQELYQKKTDVRCLVLSVCGCVGVFLAIILAVIL